MDKIFNFFRPKYIASSLAVVLAVCGLFVARPYIMELVAPEALATAAATKKLPIYCVDTGIQKKVAISFDAAWGACR